MSKLFSDDIESSHPDNDGCIDVCLHAKECFARHDDPDEALQELMDLYCDNCVLSSMEED